MKRQSRRGRETIKTISVALFAAAVGYASVQPAQAAQPGMYKEKVHYSFCALQNCADGAIPQAALIDVNGTLFGTTGGGGANCLDEGGCGTVFALDRKSGAETVIYSFCGQQNCADGSEPLASLIDVNGTLYGTTSSGGTYGNGTVFALDPGTGAETVLYSFCSQPNCADGEYPESSLIDVNGLLYGTTPEGGTDVDPCGEYGCGTVFSVDPDTGAETVLYAFCSQFGQSGEPECADGFYPEAGLTALNGTLYGATFYGGPCCDLSGTVFSVDPDTGVENVLYSFCSQENCTDGEGPLAGMIDVNGTLFGTTAFGGNLQCGCGTAFSFDPATGAETVLHEFGNHTSTDGALPRASLLDVNGTLYGTTFYGGNDNNGTVFSLDPATDAEAVLYSFCRKKNCADGANPSASLIAVKDKLYGTATAGGAHGYGEVFAIKP